jgi:hypothetical protein
MTCTCLIQWNCIGNGIRLGLAPGKPVTPMGLTHLQSWTYNPWDIPANFAKLIHIDKTINFVAAPLPPVLNIDETTVNILPLHKFDQHWVGGPPYAQYARGLRCATWFNMEFIIRGMRILYLGSLNPLFPRGQVRSCPGQNTFHFGLTCRLFSYKLSSLLKKGSLQL